VNGKRSRVGVRLAEELLHPPRELALGAPDEALAGEPVEGDARDLGGAPDRRQLVLVLDRPQLLDEAVARDRLDPAGVQPRVALEGERRRLEPDAAREQLGQRLEKIALGFDELDALDLAPPLRVAIVGEEPDALGLDEESCVRAVQPAQVEDVALVGDEERLLEPFAEAIDAIVHDCSAK
jgi:hypothetical protein